MAVVLKILNSTTIRMREGTTASTHDSKAGNLSLCHSPRPQFYIFPGEGATFGGAQGAIVTVAKGSLLAEFMRPYMVLGIKLRFNPTCKAVLWLWTKFCFVV